MAANTAPRAWLRGRSRGAIFGNWPFAAKLAIAIAFICLIGQVSMWLIGIANAGGPERYVRSSTDYRAVLSGGLTIHDGMGALLYDMPTQHAFQSRVLAPYFTLGPAGVLPNSHPPFESLLIAPLMDLPYAVPYGAWTLIEIAALVGSLYLLASALPLPSPTRWTLIALACSYHPFHRVLWLGQSTPLVLLGFCSLYSDLKRGRDWRAGLGLALILLKPQLAVPVLVLLLLHRHWRPLIAAATVWAGFSVAIMPVIGSTWPLRYARFLLDSAGWGAAQGEHPALMFTWRGLAFHLLGDRLAWLVGPLASLCAVLSIGLIVWGWGRTRRSLRGPLHPGTLPIDDTLWVLTILVTLLIPQHLYLHDYMLLIMPAWIVAARFAATPPVSGWARYWQPFLWAGYLSSFLLFFFVDSPAIAVVPNVLMLALGLILLARHLAQPTRRSSVVTA